MLTIFQIERSVEAELDTHWTLRVFCFASNDSRSHEGGES